MIFFFGFGNLPPGWRRFLSGAMVAALLLLLLELFTEIPVFEFGLLVPAIALGAGYWNYIRGVDRTRPVPSELEQAIEKPKEAPKDAEVASRAMRQAGLKPETARVQLTDVGMLVYRGSKQVAAIARGEPVMTSATHIRPFIRLDSPLKATVSQEITYQVIDASGRAVLRDVNVHRVEPGENFLPAKSWLPVSDETVFGRWTLQVRLGQTLIGLHRFRWANAEPIVADDFIAVQSDGELDLAAIRSRLNDHEPMTLEELLADQTPPQQTRTRR